MVTILGTFKSMPSIYQIPFCEYNLPDARFTYSNYVFSRNPRISCKSLPQIDLTKWKDTGKSCSIKNKVISLGRHKRVSPCVNCVCTLEGVCPFGNQELYHNFAINTSKCVFYSQFAPQCASPIVRIFSRFSRERKFSLTRRVSSSVPSRFAIIN